MNLTTAKIDELMRLSVMIEKEIYPVIDGKMTAENVRQLDAAMCEFLRYLFTLPPYNRYNFNGELGFFKNVTPEVVDRLNKGLDDELTATVLLDINKLLTIPHEYKIFRNVALNFIRIALEPLVRRQIENYAVATWLFFSRKDWLKEITEMSTNEKYVRPFTEIAKSDMKYSVIHDEKNSKPGRPKLMFAEGIYFTNLQDFMVTDLFRGLRIGHATFQCRCCGKYFMQTDALKRFYCDGQAPQNPKMSCKTYGKNNGLGKQITSSGEEHIAANKAKATIRQHKSRGNVSAKDAKTALNYVDEQVYAYKFNEKPDINALKRQIEPQAVYKTLNITYD